MFWSPVLGSCTGSGIGQKPLTLYLGFSVNSGLASTKLFNCAIVEERAEVFVALFFVYWEIFSVISLNLLICDFPEEDVVILAKELLSWLIAWSILFISFCKEVFSWSLALNSFPLVESVICEFICKTFKFSATNTGDEGTLP